MQEVFCVAGTSEGPILLLAPLISAHHKKLHGLGMREIVADVLEKIVVPAQGNFVLIKRGGGAEIYVANLTARTGVAANRDQEMLSTASGFVLAVQLQANVVA